MIPEFRADDEYTAWLSGQLMPDYAHHAILARNEAQRRIQEFGITEYSNRLHDAVRHAADNYARKFPDLVNPDRTLRGFRPEVVAEFYVLLSKSPGRDGRPAFKQAVAGMAAAARTRQEAA